jgi:transcriptional regulator with XRE-family HTH domain
MISKIWRPVFAALVGQGAVDLHVGERLKSFRLRYGISASEIAALLSVSQRQIQRFEAGHKRISASQLFMLARHFDVTVAAFFDRRVGSV